MHFHGLDDAIGVDDESAAQSQAFFCNVHTKGVGHCVGGVANEWELGLAYGGRCLVPHLVREVCVGGDDVHLGTGLLELGIVVSRVFDFGGAVEGESGWHENQHRPLALQAGVGHFNELALAATVDEGGGFERLNWGVDQGHEGDSVGFGLNTLVSLLKACGSAMTKV